MQPKRKIRGELSNKVAFFLFPLIVLFLSNNAWAIQLTKQTMQLKTGSMLGSVGISMAQWDLEFDEELYYFEAPPCAPGLTRTNLTAVVVNANPCWAGCDFTSPDPDLCGQPFNTSDPTCQEICDQHPHKDAFCDYTNRPWTVIEPDIESPLFTVNINENLLLRFNWLRIEQGFRYEGMPTFGPLTVKGSALMDPSINLAGGTFCMTKDSPSSFSNVCPSAQCFYYGTWELTIGTTIGTLVTYYTGTSSHILRTFPQTQGNTRRTEPRSDAPPTYPVQSSDHTPLEFGVTVDVQFTQSNTVHFFQLTTPYCGFINVLHEKATWERANTWVTTGVSTDASNPKPISVITDILLLNGGSKPLWICPKPPETNVTVFFMAGRYVSSGEPLLSKYELHYLTVDYYRPEDGWKKFRLGSSAGESGFSNFTNFPPLANWPNALAANLFRISCPSPANVTQSIYFDCRSGSATHGTCVQFLFGVPVEPWTVSLLPVPLVVSNINPEGFANIKYPTFQTASKRLSAMLILELTSDGSVVSQTLGADWQSLWSQCVLHIGPASPIASSDGDWFIADLALNQTEPECVYSEFDDLSQLITTGIESMASDPFSAYSERVLIDELTFHDPWQACTALIATELSTTYMTNVSIFSSTSCLNSSATDDPCCSSDLSWSQCCAPKNLVALVEALALNDATTTALCRHSECVGPLLSEYYNSDLLETSGRCSGPNLNERLRAPLRVYRDCKAGAFGEDLVLPPCVVDSDCTSLFANLSTSCNQVTKQCVFNLSASVEYFFECIADNLPIEARIKLIALNDYSIRESDTLALQLYATYGKTTTCADESFGSPWSLANKYIETLSPNGGCSVCSFNATDVSYQPPPWCDARPNSDCQHQWKRPSGFDACETKVCNWDQSNNCNTSDLGTFFCGVCESDAICSQVSNVTSADLCTANTSVCFLADGTVRTDLTHDECAQANSCTLMCGPTPCAKREDCEAVGYCDTDDEIYEAMVAAEWNTATNVDGFCAVPMNPYNSPDCGITKAGMIPTSYGCVIFGDCTGGVAAEICTPNYYTKDLCATVSIEGAVWWPRFDNASCQSKQGCNEQLVTIQSLSSLGTRLRSPKDEEQCSKCGGEMEALSSWVSGRWLPGTARTAHWTQRALVDRYKLAESIDFNGLYDDIYAASRAAVAFQLQNNIQCSYQTLNGLISKVACACTTDLSREECFSGDFITSAGEGEVCPLTSNTIVAPPATLSYDSNDVVSQLQNQCVQFTINRIASRYFYGEAPPPISTGFVPEFTIRGWNAVVNERDAMVGQVVGDGIQIHFTQNGKYLRRLKVCLDISSSIAVSKTESFTVYGLGYWTGKTEPATVMPYNHPVNVTLENGGVCASVLLDQTGKDASFVPIYYRADWQDQPSSRFSRGQQALLYFVATLYAILCCTIVVQLVRLIAVGAWDLKVGTNYIWVLLFFVSIIRAVYIYLVAADVLGQQNMHLLVDFWMMDLPTLLYLISDSVIALSFLFLLLASKDDRFQHQRFFWTALSVLVSFIVAIFVSVLLAFNFAVVSSQGSHGPPLCSTYTDNSASATAIRIVYECVLFTIALSTALLGFTIAGKLWWSFRERQGSSSLLAIGIVSSFGILSDSLAFLIYYIVNNPTPYFAIVLIFTEILPMAFLVILVANTQIKNKQRQGRPIKRQLESTHGHSYSVHTASIGETAQRLGGE